ncbi:MAG TPA: diguanylate cyclase [Micromonosporaceae bacterium]
MGGQVTLRARLTAAFLAVVLGPVLLGAVFVGATVTAVSRERPANQLTVAASAVRANLGALCDRLRAAAQTAAVLTDAGRTPGAAQKVVDQGMASAVRLTRANGNLTAVTFGAPTGTWALCDAPDQPHPDPVALAARVVMRDPDGTLLGYATAAQTLDAALLYRLTPVTGVALTVLDDRDQPLQSTESSQDAALAARAARGLAPDRLALTDDGRYVRLLPPAADQPVPLLLAAARHDPDGLYALLLIAVVAAALGAVAAAWWLARSTTRPLSELARAADRVAGGDLAARVPVRSRDEVGRLGQTFNRMTREMQGYVAALMASRDQLRNQLGLLGDTLSSTHDLKGILAVILQTALAATGARAGVVLLADPVEPVLVGQCGEGLAGPHADPTELRIPFGAGLLGDVAATRQPRRGRVDRDGPVLSPREPVCRTYVAVPFSAPTPAATDESGYPVSLLRGPAVRGVLALYDRLGNDEFDDADLVKLRNFAAQAAVAVDNVRLHEEAKELSITDPLTGLGNYRFLKEQIRIEVERANRFGRRLCVLALDLDRFKDVNDTYGHGAGDAVLAEFANRLRGEIREVDKPFRQGGEEFVVILPETDEPGGVTVASRLANAVRSTPMTVGTGQPGGAETAVPVTVSIGIAVYPDHAGTGPELLEAADDALYAAKAAGRDAYRVASPRSAVTEPTPTGAVGPTPAEQAEHPADGGPGGASGALPPPRQSRGR